MSPIQPTLSNMFSHILSLRGEVNDLEVRVKDLGARVKGLEARIKRLEDQNKHRKRENKRLKDQVSALEDLFEKILKKLSKRSKKKKIRAKQTRKKLILLTKQMRHQEMQEIELGEGLEYFEEGEGKQAQGNEEIGCFGEEFEDRHMGLHQKIPRKSWDRKKIHYSSNSFSIST